MYVCRYTYTYPILCIYSISPCMNNNLVSKFPKMIILTSVTWVSCWPCKETTMWLLHEHVVGILNFYLVPTTARDLENIVKPCNNFYILNQYLHYLLTVDWLLSNYYLIAQPTRKSDTINSKMRFLQRFWYSCRHVK